MIDNTFFREFTGAEFFGKDPVQDTYKRVFKEWHNDYEYLTALVFVLKQKIEQWQQREKGDPDEITACGAIPEEFAELYNDLWGKTDQYAAETLKGEELAYFYRELD